MRLRTKIFLNQSLLHDLAGLFILAFVYKFAHLRNFNAYVGHDADSALPNQIGMI